MPLKSPFNKVGTEKVGTEIVQLVARAGKIETTLLERMGLEIVRVPPGADGRVSAESVVAALTRDTRLVALMRANNELGTLQPVAEVAHACREREIPVLCDAVQAVGKVPVSVGELYCEEERPATRTRPGPDPRRRNWRVSEVVPQA